MKNHQGKESTQGPLLPFNGDRDNGLGRRLLQTCAAMAVPTCLIIGSIRYAHSGSIDRYVLSNLFYAGLCAWILFQSLRGNWRIGAHLFLWSGWLTTTFLAWSAGGARSANTMNYAVLLVACGWLLGHRTALLMLGLTLLGQAAFVLAELHGQLPAPPLPPVSFWGVYNLMVLGLIAALTLLSRRSYHQQLRREQRYSEVLAARESQMRKLSQALEQSPEAVLITDLNHCIEYANPLARQLACASEADLQGQDARRLLAERLSAANLDNLQRCLAAGQVWRGELRQHILQGQERIESLTVTALREPDGRITHHVWMRQDVTAQREAEARLQHLALHDAHTGLPNRTQLEQRLAERLRQPGAHRGNLALVQIHIDRFKTLIEAGGQSAGEALLLALSDRLRAALGRHELLARLGTDELAVLVAGLHPEPGAATHQVYGLTRHIQETLRAPFPLGAQAGGDVTITVSQGVALCQPDETACAAQVMRSAATALNQALRQGGAQTAFFEAVMGEAAERRFRIERELRDALQSDQLRLFLQPQVDARGRWCGAEALVRWDHPTRGMVSPGLFIPVAEETDLIVGLGQWVFSEAARLIAAEARAGRALPLSVNLSPRQFRQPDFVAWMQGLLAEHGVDPALLTLEITESLVIGNVEETITRMQELRKLGLHFSIDDFGTGYSSLAYLKRLPICELKIDKAFIQDAPTHPDDAALVETILSVASHMRLKVVAEGVETREQADFLARRDASVVLQGYLFGKPAPAQQWLQQWQQAHLLPLLQEGTQPAALPPGSGSEALELAAVAAH